MKYPLLPCLLLALATPASAAFHIEAIKATHDGYEYEFPRVTDKGLAAANINTWLHATTLQKLPGHYKSSAFEDVWPQGDSQSGVTYLGFSIGTNAPGFLSLRIDSEYMAAHPNQTERNYNFDAITGQPITLRDIFSPDGLQQLSTQVSQLRVARAKSFVAGGTVAGTRLADDQEIAATQRDMYTACLDSLGRDDLSADDLSLGGKQLTLRHDSCAAHIDKGIDDLGEFAVRLPYEALQGQLNGYGRCLLVDKRTDCPRGNATLSASVWRGKLDGRYPITLVLENEGPDSTISGAYFYDKYARYISLSGKRDAQGRLELSEEGPPPATFSLKATDTVLSGTWQQDGGKSLPIELH